MYFIGTLFLGGDTTLVRKNSWSHH